MTIAIAANALTHTEARHEAKYMTDKMAHDLHLMSTQYRAVYDINLDYLRSVNHHKNSYGKSWKHRNRMLRRVLTASQYDKYIHIEHFYRPAPPRPVPVPKKHAPRHRHHPRLWRRRHRRLHSPLDRTQRPLNRQAAASLHGSRLVPFWRRHHRPLLHRRQNGRAAQLHRRERRRVPLSWRRGLRPCSPASNPFRRSAYG